MRKAKNGGFTLAELLVVIVILGIAAGFTYLSINNVAGSAAKEAASDMNYLISQCRAACLSKSGESYIFIKNTSPGCVAEYYEGEAEPIDTVELGGARVACSYNGGSAVPQAGLKLGFARDTGAERTTGDCVQITDITFSGGGVVRSVELVPSTGSHRVS